MNADVERQVRKAAVSRRIENRASSACFAGAPQPFDPAQGKCLSVLLNTGWTNEARAASLEVRRAKAAARQVSPEQAAFDARVRAEMQEAREKWDAYYKALSDEEKAAAQAKYPWLAKLALQWGGSKVKPPEFPPVTLTPGGNAQMYFDYLDSQAAAKKEQQVQERAKLEEKAMLDFIHWQSTKKAGLNIPLSEYQKKVPAPKEYTLENDPYMTKAEKAYVRMMDKAREDAATAVRKAKDAARRAEAAVIYGKGDPVALKAAHEAAKAAVRDAVEKQKKLGAPSSVQPANLE
jgi:hypothetical protein